MHEFNNLEIMGDALDEYKAIQEAEAGIEPEMASDAEIKKLMLSQMLENDNPTIDSANPIVYNGDIQNKKPWRFNHATTN